MYEHAVRYPNYGPEANAILDLARAARQIGKTFPGASAGNFIQHLEKFCAELVVESYRHHHRLRRKAGSGEEEEVNDGGRLARTSPRSDRP